MSEEDTGWWNDGVELEPSKGSSSISRPKDKTENSIKQVSTLLIVNITSAVVWTLS